MKVRYKSGNQLGQVVDLPEIEAQAALDTGFAEIVELEEGAAPKAPAKARASVQHFTEENEDEEDEDKPYRGKRR